MGQNLIKFAKKILQKGGLVIFPTETVYGIGGNANNSKAVKLIYDKKKRPKNNPLIIHYKNLLSFLDHFEKKFLVSN